MSDQVNHPPHYNSHPSGVECITVTEHMNFNLGNAVKYIWRAGLKSDAPVIDLEKAAWYIEREITRLTKARVSIITTDKQLSPEEAAKIRSEWEKAHK